MRDEMKEGNSQEISNGIARSACSFLFRSDGKVRAEPLKSAETLRGLGGLR